MNPYRTHTGDIDADEIICALENGNSVPMIEAEGHISHEEMIKAIRAEYKWCSDEANRYAADEQWSDVIDYAKACRVIITHFGVAALQGKNYDTIVAHTYPAEDD